MEISRRDLLELGAGAATMLVTGVNLFGAQENSTVKTPIGLQLYSVRDDCAKDLPGVLRAVARMGYQGVEFAGYHGRKADELRKLLDDNGLKCCGTHTGLEMLTGDAFKSTVEFNKTLGNRFLIVPGLPAANTASVQALKDTAKLFSDLAAKAKAVGMRVGYHSHAGDFKALDGQILWDIIFGNTDGDVVMQLDTGNCLAGGGDPVAILKRYPGRAVTIHVKEYGGKHGAVIGEGKVEWRKVLELCARTGGTEWYIVEQEEYAAAPLDSVKACLENLRKMLA